MANLPNDRTVINVRERPASSDINQAQSQMDRTLRRYQNVLYQIRSALGSPIGSAQSGFISDGFRPASTGGMGIRLISGLGFMSVPADVPTDIGGAIGLDDREAYKPVLLNGDQSLTVPAADPTNPRIDIIEVKYDRRLENPLSRDVLNTGTGAFVPTVVQKTLGVALNGLTATGSGAATAVIYLKTGTPAGAPVAPATDAGYIRVGSIFVPALAASITDLNIVDNRPLLFGSGTQALGCRVHLLNSTSVPQVDRLICSPGLTLAAQKIVSASGNSFTLWLAGSGAPARYATVTATFDVNGLVLLTELYTVHVSELAGSLAAVNQNPVAPVATLFADATKFNPTYQFNSNNWIAAWDVQVVRQSNAITNLTLPFPCFVNLTVTLGF